MSKKSPLDGMLVATSYKSVLVAQAVHTYKYRFLKDLHVPLAKLIIQAVLESRVRLPDIIVPVPLHQRRLRWRGFNQSQLLANFIAQNLTPGFPIEHRDDIIKRTRFTHPQMEVKKYSQRQKNISGAFFLRSETKSCIKNKRIFLIDDIATTGSTILECAKILKKAGTKEVFAIVVARQSCKARN